MFKTQTKIHASTIHVSQDVNLHLKKLHCDSIGHKTHFGTQTRAQMILCHVVCKLEK